MEILLNASHSLNKSDSFSDYSCGCDEYNCGCDGDSNGCANVDSLEYNPATDDCYQGA